MSAVKKSDIPAEAEMMSKFWNLIKDYYIPEENESYWSSLQEKCEKIYKDCPTRLTFHLLDGFRNFLAEKTGKAVQDGQR